MASALYKLYIESVFKLSKSLVIHQPNINTVLNANVASIGIPIDENDPNTWPYYQNMAGIYHRINTPMTVQSFDTGETILFSRDVLANHPITNKTYRTSKRYYDALVSRYPEQISLIDGILNPIPIDVAYAAPAGKILRWDTSLVEPREVNLISELQSRIDGFLFRWSNDDYLSVDDLWCARCIAELAFQIPTWINLIRLNNRHTAYVHSFHIRQYLESNGGLHKYIHYLSDFQVMWLYRNIAYVRKNPGTNDTLEWLLDAMLTQRGFPASYYELQQDPTDITLNLTSRVELTREPLNELNDDLRNVRLTVNDVLTKEEFLTKDNSRLMEAAEKQITEAVQWGAYGQYNTKIIESNVVDRKDSTRWPLTETLLRNWVWGSTHGKYNINEPVTDPSTGESIVFNARELLILYIYAINGARGLRPTEIPTLWQFRILRPTTELPTAAALLRMSPIKLQRWQVELALSSIENFPTTNSIAEFYAACQVANSTEQIHRRLVLRQQHLQVRAIWENITNQLYKTVECNLVADGEPTDYLGWLSRHPMPINTYSEMELQQLADEIIRIVTGKNDLALSGLLEVHNNTIALLRELSSYSVQFINDVRGEDLINPEGLMVRLGDCDVVNSAALNINTSTTKVDKITCRGSQAFYGDLDHYFGAINQRVSATSKLNIPLAWSATSELLPSVKFRIILPTVRIKIADTQ